MLKVALNTINQTLTGHSHQRLTLLSGEMLDATKVVKYYKIVSFKRGHPSYKVTFSLQKWWPHKRETTTKRLLCFGSNKV